MEYTKGNWELDETGTAIFSNGRLVANCGGFSLTQHESATLKENKANAHLIAAAPKMYKALIVAERWLKGRLKDDHVDMELIQEALAEAKSK